MITQQKNRNTAGPAPDEKGALQVTLPFPRDCRQQRLQLGRIVMIAPAYQALRQQVQEALRDAGATRISGPLSLGVELSLQERRRSNYLGAIQFLVDALVSSRLFDNDQVAEIRVTQSAEVRAGTVIVSCSHFVAKGANDDERARTVAENRRRRN